MADLSAKQKLELFDQWNLVAANSKRDFCLKVFLPEGGVKLLWVCVETRGLQTPARTS